MSTTPSEEFLDNLAAQVLENPSKEFLKCVPESIRLTLQRKHKPKTQQVTKEEQEAFKQDWSKDRILKRVRFAGDTF